MARAEKPKKAGAKAAAKPKKGAPPAEPFFRPFSKLASGRTEKTGAAEAPPKAPKAQKPQKPAVVENAANTANTANEIDAETFARYMAGVRALEDRPSRIPATASQIERAARGERTDDPDADARARMRSLVSEGIRFETVDDGAHLEGRRLDVDPRELRRLRRAQYAIDGRLDLHGLGAQEARQAVETFIKKHALAGDRVVLIVHGKGTHSPRGVSVLRGEIAAWLSQGRSARHTAAFSTAPDEHGGAGAVLVLLAR